MKFMGFYIAILRQMINVSGLWVYHIIASLKSMIERD